MYWDASAVVPLVIREPSSDDVRSWLADDSSIVTWFWTRVELTSALERRVREGLLTRRHRRAVLDRFRALAESWDEVTDILAVRSQALSLLARHPLRAADAAQLSCALLVAEERDPSSLTFVCLDTRLAAAAEAEGLRVLYLPEEDEPA